MNDKKIFKFLKRKEVKNILGDNFIPTEYHLYQLRLLFADYSNLRTIEGYFTTIAYFIYYDLKWYKQRLEKIKKLPKCPNKYSYFLRYGRIYYLDLYNELVYKRIKDTMPNTKTYWKHRNITDENVIKSKIQNIQKERSKIRIEKTGDYRLHSVRSIRYWMVKKGLTYKQAKREVWRIQKRDLNFFQEKYGILDGTKKYNNRIENYKEAFDSFSQDELDLINKKKNLFSVESHLLRGKSEKEANYLAEYYKSLVIKNDSKVSVELFSKISSILQKHYCISENLIFFSKQNGEKNVGSYKIDFYLSTTGKAVEFYGNYWHGNPEMYNSEFLIRGIPVKDIWKRDKNRIENIKNNDEINDLKIVWEKDYKIMPNKIINEVIEFLLT